MGAGKNGRHMPVDIASPRRRNCHYLPRFPYCNMRLAREESKPQRFDGNHLKLKQVQGSDPVTNSTLLRSGSALRRMDQLLQLTGKMSLRLSARRAIALNFSMSPFRAK